MKDETGTYRKIEEKICEDRISALPEDLLVEILLLLPTADAVATAVLSKQWHSVWKMLPRLKYEDVADNEGYESVWWSTDKLLLQLSKAYALEKLRIRIGHQLCPVDVDVGKLIDDVVNRCIQWLDFTLDWSEEPTSLSNSLYTCKTLKKLTLSNKILVDVPSKASLPLLVELRLNGVVYKDDDSLVRLLSSCHVLQNLFVERETNGNDNVKIFGVRVPSLQLFKYTNYNDKRDICESLVIDSPGLKNFSIWDYWGDSCLIENMPPCLDMAKVVSASHPNDNFLRSLSSVMYLNLNITNKADAICSAVNFSRLIECKLTPHYPSVNWVKSVMRLLRNSPKLRALMIISNYFRQYEDLPLGSSVPECLSSSLKIVEWEDYRGTREEKKVMTYILENSKCLKTIRISLKCDNEEKKKTVMEELESMYRVSESSQLFFSTQFRWSSMMKQHPAYQIMSSI